MAAQGLKARPSKVGGRVLPKGNLGFPIHRRFAFPHIHVERSAEPFLSGKLLYQNAGSGTLQRL